MKPVVISYDVESQNDREWRVEDSAGNQHLCRLQTQGKGASLCFFPYPEGGEETGRMNFHPRVGSRLKAIVGSDIGLPVGPSQITATVLTIEYGDGGESVERLQLCVEASALEPVTT